MSIRFETTHDTHFSEQDSPLRHEAEGRRGLSAAATRKAAILSAEQRLSVALSELVELGVNPMRLDLLALAEAGQQLRRARAL